MYMRAQKTCKMRALHVHVQYACAWHVQYACACTHAPSTPPTVRSGPVRTLRVDADPNKVEFSVEVRVDEQRRGVEVRLVAHGHGPTGQEVTVVVQHRQVATETREREEEIRAGGRGVFFFPGWTVLIVRKRACAYVCLY